MRFLLCFFIASFINCVSFFPGIFLPEEIVKEFVRKNPEYANDSSLQTRFEKIMEAFEGDTYARLRKVRILGDQRKRKEYWSYEQRKAKQCGLPLEALEAQEKNAEKILEGIFNSSSFELFKQHLAELAKNYPELFYEDIEKETISSNKFLADIVLGAAAVIGLFAVFYYGSEFLSPKALRKVFNVPIVYNEILYKQGFAGPSLESTMKDSLYQQREIFLQAFGKGIQAGGKVAIATGFSCALANIVGSRPALSFKELSIPLGYWNVTALLYASFMGYLYRNALMQRTSFKTQQLKPCSTSQASMLAAEMALKYFSGLGCMGVALCILSGRLEKARGCTIKRQEMIELLGEKYWAYEKEGNVVLEPIKLSFSS